MNDVGKNMEANHKMRNSSLELLRLVAIFAIIGHHFVVHGIFLTGLLPIDAAKSGFDFSIAFDSLFVFGGMFGNSCFLLITGYFMVKRKIKWQRILLLVIAVYFYYWVILAIFSGLHLATIEGSQFLKIIAPFLFGSNWFVCCYIFFCLFIPYINRFLLAISQAEYQRFLKLIFMLCFVLPVCRIETYFEPQKLILFVVMYVFGAYAKIYGLDGKYSEISFWNKVIVIDVLLLIITPILTVMTAGRTGGDFSILLAVILAIALFARCLLKPPFHNEFINRLAQSVLGVYLIHDNAFVRHFLWRDWLPNISYVHTDMMIPIFILKVLAVFIVCTLIDQLRLMIVERPASIWINNHWDVIEKRCPSFLPFSTKKSR